MHKKKERGGGASSLLLDGRFDILPQRIWTELVEGVRVVLALSALICGSVRPTVTFTINHVRTIYPSQVIFLHVHLCSIALYPTYTGSRWPTTELASEIGMFWV